MIGILKKIVCIVLLLSLFWACKDDEILLTGDIKVSEVENKNEYAAPLVLEKDVDGYVFINGKSIRFDHGVYELQDAGFFEMILNNNDTILFVLIDEVRGQSEWGLYPWVPKEPEFCDDFDGSVNVVCPKHFHTGLSVPFVLKVGEWSIDNSVFSLCQIASGETFKIKRGIGSFSSLVGSDGKIQFFVGNTSYKEILTELNTEDVILSDTIFDDLIIGKNKLIHITHNLMITNTASLSIGEGCVVMIDEGVNVENLGPICFSGTRTNPILVTCSNKDSYFGGFISTGKTSKVQGEYTFFTRFSSHSENDYQYGHANHQALFKSDNSALSFMNCYFFDSEGQVFYPKGCDVELDGCFIQRVKTGGQINSSSLTINSSYFSDFPDDSQNYNDEDNDALYLSGTDAIVGYSMFMNTKDDGIDSGGSEGGDVVIDHCRFEACFHEGMALSSGNDAVKNHYIQNSIFENCQQGVELGYSSSNHFVVIDKCSIYSCYNGVRYGDNYDWDTDGTLTVRNSDIRGNVHNSWNMVRSIWGPKTENLIIEDTTNY